MELSDDQREAAEALAIHAGLGRRCNGPTCENFLSTGEMLEDDDLQNWLKKKEDVYEELSEFEDLSEAEEAILTVVDEALEECGCVLGS